MSRKVTQQEFERRFKINHPDALYEIIEYTAISNPCKIKCLKCGKVHTQMRAREFISHHFCSEDTTNMKQLVIDRLNSNKDYEFVKEINKDCYVQKHLICGNEQKRTYTSGKDNPFSCKYCGTIKTLQQLTIEEVQQRLDDAFDGTIKILEYEGQLKKSLFKCLKCGKIFRQHTVSLTLYSRGCPSCDRWQSKGEKYIAKLLTKNNIKYQEQYKVDELPLQKFDFAILDDEDKVKYFIEVQGEQHFREVPHWDNLAKNQERDQRKRDYCAKNNIPLYELVYLKGTFENLDILPIEFNDYLREGEQDISD